METPGWHESANSGLILMDDAGAWEDRRFITLMANPETDFPMPPPTLKHGSFHSHSGICLECGGLGSTLSLDPDPDGHFRNVLGVTASDERASGRWCR